MNSLDPAKRPTNDGFTLIELLVVIAIIAILAGLSFPAIQGAMGSGKKAQARNDVNQLASAIKAFQLEYGRLPFSGTGSGDTASAPNASVITALISTNALNPRGIVFFEPKIAKGGKGGLSGSGSSATYKDPWGSDYVFDFDTSYDNKIIADVGLGSQTYFNTVIVQSPGPDRDINNRTDNISNVR